MRSSPALATWLMERAGVSEALAGDLIEEYRRGRSAAWYWRQVLLAILASAGRDIRVHKLLAVRAIATGWIVLLLLFVALGDLVANGLAYQLWHWTRADGYGKGVWWPFWITAVFLSYSGFAIAGWAVARLHRRHATAMLLAYVASVLVVLAASVTIVACFGPIAVPHPLFYVVSVSLPYQWRSGFLLAPLVILLGGLAGARRRGETIGNMSGVSGGNESAVDRDRGRLHSLTPPTPPCVRVRTRRFERLR